MTYIFFFTFIFSLLSIFFVRKHYLLTLINLELIFLIMFFFLFFYLNFFNFEGYFSLIFLILGVCEASLGLSLLVYLVRKFNFDYLDSFNLC
uniref:NADH-ubiquinone oxidoreductase chain 4L n=1 Tax=Bambusiphaga furca TaxID=2566015 RepID=A0A7S4YZF8_9HEMI|nr:NADH dehydrogenase subunit 4L [Bambusiphaga furca]QBZ37961.1 NADH dehydrogenase subunit 4L [Bambusiphaga furca]